MDLTINQLQLLPGQLPTVATSQQGVNSRGRLLKSQHLNMSYAEDDGEARNPPTAVDGEKEAQSVVPGAAAAEKRGDEEAQSDVQTDVNGEAVSELDEPFSFEEGVCGGASPATGLLQLLLGEEEQVGAESSSSSSSSSLLLSSLELSDTTIYEPCIRALLGTASHFCQVGSHAFHTDRLSASCFAVELQSASHTHHPRFRPSPIETRRSSQ